MTRIKIWRLTVLLHFCVTVFIVLALLILTEDTDATSASSSAESDSELDNNANINGDFSKEFKGSHAPVDDNADNPSTFGSSTTENEPKSNPNCEDDVFYILVSTIDGKFTALDLENKGTLRWSVDADTTPLYSSSLANMEMIRNKKKLRVIPSLDGALYQYDGEKVEPVPMSAETLLSSTYKLGDDSMIVGSKELRNYGIDLKSGKVYYTCGSDGCHSNEGKASTDTKDNDFIVVLTRTTQVVRSVDIKNGLEKWNFSVGQHEVNLPPTKQEMFDDEDVVEDIDADHEDQPLPFITSSTTGSSEECPPKDDKWDDTDLENYLRLIVPEGKIVALSKEDTGGIRWEHKFDSPIAKAWLLRNGKLEPMNLFDGRHIPTLGNFQPEDLENESMHQPLLYIGSHQKLLYIQPSPHMEVFLKTFPAHRRVGHVIDPKIKVSWRPYLNTASARTPIFNGNRPGLSDETPEEMPHTVRNALTVWHEDYPFDTGYFLYPEFRDVRSPGGRDNLLLNHVPEPRPRTLVADAQQSIYDYWKQIMGISILMAVSLHIIMTNFSSTLQDTRESSSRLSSESRENNSSDSLQVVATVGHKESESDMYESRFANDFQCISCLGKGGFGIVFEAMNRVDDNQYAVKRTLLPKNEKARAKVLREVKNLPKLDHLNIVRFFSAWTECPPQGWQEERDKQFLASCSDMSGPTSFSVFSSTSADWDRKKVKQKVKVKTPPGVQEEAELDCTDSIVFGFEDSMALAPNKGSGEFSVHSSLNDDSYSVGDQTFGVASPNRSAFQLESFSSDSPEGCETTNSKSSIPFSAYGTNSSKHSQEWDIDVTEDSVVFEASKNCSNNVTDDSIVFDHTNFTDDSIVFEASTSDCNILKRNKNLLLAKRKGSLQPYTADSGTGTTNGDSDPLNPIKEHTIDIHSVNSECTEGDVVRKDKSGAKAFLYIQMQLCQKDTLKEFLKETSSSRDTSSVVTIFGQIVDAVNHIHNYGLMHRDLKPSNIFFSNEGLIKVGDFGLVTSFNVEQDDVDPGSVLTAGSHTSDCGTTLYMSPEQISRKPYDFKVDIFSLGLILMELRLSFSTEMERIRTLQDARRQHFPTSFQLDFPEEYDLVTRMMSEDPSLRPTTQDILEHNFLRDFFLSKDWRNQDEKRKRTISDISNNS